MNNKNNNDSVSFREKDLAVLNRMHSFTKRKGNLNSQKNWVLKQEVSDAIYNFFDDIMNKREFSIDLIENVVFKEELQPILYSVIGRHSFRSNFEYLVSGPKITNSFKEGIINCIVEGFCSNLILNSAEHEQEKKRKKKKNEEPTGDFKIEENFNVLQRYMCLDLPKFKKVLDENNLWETLLNARIVSYSADSNKTFVTANFAQQTFISESLRVSAQITMEQNMAFKKFYDLVFMQKEFKEALKDDSKLDLGNFFYQDKLNKVNLYHDIEDSRDFSSYKYASKCLNMGQLLNVLSETFIYYPDNKKVKKIFDYSSDVKFGFKPLGLYVWFEIMEKAHKLDVPSVDKYLAHMCYEEAYNVKTKISQTELQTLTLLFGNIVENRNYGIEELKTIRDVVGKKIGIDLYEVEVLKKEKILTEDFNIDYTAQDIANNKLREDCLETGANSVRFSEKEIHLAIEKELNAIVINEKDSNNDNSGFSSTHFKM